jgi:hypothetical protein
MFFVLSELVSWLGLTVCEIWMHLAAVFAFTVLVVVRVEMTPLSWWTVFSPLFVGDALNAYFNMIVFIRQFLDRSYKAAAIRAAWSYSHLLLIFLCEYLLCEKLQRENSVEFSEVMAPIFVLLQFVMIRACQLH